MRTVAISLPTMLRQSLSMVALLCLALTACTAESSERPAAPSRVGNPVSVPSILLLDGSESMAQTDAPGPRIDAAKNAAQVLIDSLPDAATLGLQTYGTKTGSAPEDKAAGCHDVTTLVPLSPLDRGTVKSAVEAITPSGYTPISLALTKAADQLPADNSAQAIVLVSDGEDTCDTPPCETAAQLKKDRPGLTISTVGFKVDGAAADQLRCIAEAAGGLFVTAANANQLSARLLATQDLDQANQSLSAAGIAGITLGATVDDIRAIYTDFPAVSTSGTVTVTWRDCDFVFTDGNLDSIAPHGGGRTIDGLATGSPISKATDLYGEPLATTHNADGTSTLLFDADPNTDHAYRITADSNSAIAAITLCRCKPQAVQQNSLIGAVRSAPQKSPTEYEYGDMMENPGPPVLPSTTGRVTFDSPSSNITCEWPIAAEGSLICGLKQRSTPPPLRPADCAEYLGWGKTFVHLDSAGASDGVCAGGVPISNRGNVLPYGTSLIAGAYGCNSSEDGVRCVHLATGQGFLVSRTRFDIFPADGNPPAAPPNPPATVNGDVVLGAPSDQYSAGYGTSRPNGVSTNSICGNTINDVTWTSWGGPTAQGTGTWCQSSGARGRGEAPKRVSLTASDIGPCQGKLAYRQLQLDSGAAQSIC